MTKMAAMPIYGKKFWKIFFSRTRSPRPDLDLFYGKVKLGLYVNGENFYKVKLGRTWPIW